jgi:hypothetical protein
LIVVGLEALNICGAAAKGEEQYQVNNHSPQPLDKSDAAFYF